MIAPYNDLEGMKSLLGPIEQQVGVILVEPMLGAGGCVSDRHANLTSDPG